MSLNILSREGRSYFPVLGTRRQEEIHEECLRKHVLNWKLIDLHVHEGGLLSSVLIIFKSKETFKNFNGLVDFIAYQR